MIDLNFDRKHIWHPYTSMTQPLPCYPIIRTHGMYLELENGQQLIDGMSSWWSAIHGYNHPELIAAAKSQLDIMPHVMFGGFTHEPAVELCRKLVDITPPPLTQVFLCDSGSVSVEVAMKMALQYWQAQQQKRSKFLTIEHGYHGDTFAAMSVTDPKNSMHHLYQDFLVQHIFTQAPTCGFSDTWNEDDIVDLEHKIQQHHQDIAAVILEPIVQGAGGMRMYHPTFLKRVRTLCDQYQLLLIADEIATGFGRTGKMFAVEHAAITPDILCVGKALTGGMMTLAATLTTEHVSHTICHGEAGCFMHGPTFMGNPLACAVALQSLALLEKGDWKRQVLHIEQLLAQRLPSFYELPAVKHVRWLGAIGVVELHEPVKQAEIQKAFVEAGVWIRPFNCLVYIMPPFIAQPKHIHQLLDAMYQVLSSHASNRCASQ